MKACYVLLPLMLTALMIRPAPGQTPYKLPPKDVVAILDASLPPLPIVSPTRDSLLLVDVRYYPSIAELAEPVLRLAGVRINPRVGCTQRRFVDTGLSIKPLDNAPMRRVELPDGASIDSPSWSHDGKRIAFSRDLDDQVQLWTADAATGKVKAIPGVQLNDVLFRDITWLRDNRHIIALLVPEGRGPRRRPPGLRSAPTSRRARAA